MDEQTNLLASARRVASRRLRELYPEDYQRFYVEEAEARGVDLAQIEEQRRQQEIVKLEAKIAELKERLAGMEAE